MAEKRFIECEALKEHMKSLPTWTMVAKADGVYEKVTKYPEGMFNCDDVINSIDNAPTADVVEVVHGKWLKTKYPEQYQCSECYYEWTVRGMCRETPRDNDAFYCPCCGAQMDKENE